MKPITEGLRKPTCRVTGGPGGDTAVEEAEILLHRYQSASSFVFALSLTAVEMAGGSVDDWCAQQPQVTILGSNDGGGGSKKIIEGKADSCSVDWEKRVIRCEGRDATGELIEATTDPEKHQFQNKSSIDIVRELAGEKGLTVEGDGGDRAGRKHVGQDYNLLTEQDTYWNVIRQLATRDGKVAYVDGRTLHYKDVREGGDSGSLTINYTPPSGGPSRGEFVELVTTVNFGAEGEASIDSWHTRDKENNKSEEGSGDSSGSADQGGGSGGSGEGSTHWKYEYPGLTREQAKKMAEGLTAAHNRHKKQLMYTGPGDVDVNPRMTAVLSGTASTFDDTYDIDSIRFYFSGSSNQFVMTIDARTKGG